MTENENASFRLGSEPTEEARDILPHDDTRLQFAVKKLTRRTRITSLLLLVLMLSISAWGYWDLQGRFSRQANTGDREIKNITAVFDDRFNELDQQIGTVKAQFVEDFAKLDKLTIKLQKNIDQLQKSMDAIDLTGTMRKEKKAMLAQMQKSFAPIKADIDSLSKDLGAFDQRIRTQIAPLEKQIGENRTELNRFQNDLKVAVDESISRDDLALEMLKIKKAYQQRIVSEATPIRNQISLLIERVERIESKSRTANNAPKSTAGPTGTVPGSGIQEQNLP